MVAMVMPTVIIETATYLDTGYLYNTLRGGASYPFFKPTFSSKLEFLKPCLPSETPINYRGNSDKGSSKKRISIMFEWNTLTSERRITLYKDRMTPMSCNEK